MYGGRSGRQVGEAGPGEADGDRGDHERQEHNDARFHAGSSPGKTTRLTTARLSRPKSSRTANCKEPRASRAPDGQHQPEQGRAAAPPGDADPEPPQRASRRPGRMPAHRLAPGPVPDGEDVSPAAGDPERPDRRPVAGAVPQGIEHEPGEHRRDEDDEVPQSDLAGKKGEHDDRDDGPEEDQQSRVGVVEEAGDVGQPGRDPHRYRPQPPREHDAHVSGAPAVLLAHERVEIVGADPGREQDRAGRPWTSRPGARQARCARPRRRG